MHAKSILITLASVAAFATLVSLPVKADIVLSTEPVAAAPGSTDDFDVLLTNTGLSTVNIAGFNFELTTSDTNITFTDVTTDTTVAPYIFPDSLFGPDITTIASGQTVEAGDVDGSMSGAGTDVAPGQTYSLGNVDFTVAADAMNGEIATLDFTPYPGTSLSDASGDNIPFTATQGEIAIATVTPVPEPNSAILLAALALVAALLAGKRRSWRT